MSTREIDLRVRLDARAAESDSRRLGTTFEDTGRKARRLGAATDEAGGAFERFRANSIQLNTALSALGITLGAAGVVRAVRGTIAAGVEFEQAMTGVAKTVDISEAELQRLGDAFQDLSERIPASAVELGRVAELAGQLGIQTQNIESFTRVMVDLGNSTNLSAEDAATALARLANVMQTPQTAFDRLGSTIVALGNNLATTEREIVEFAQRMAGAGRIAGMTEAEVLAIAGAMSSVGVEAEAGGTAVQKALITITTAVSQGGAELAEFAAVAGMSSQEFAERWEADAGAAFLAFVEGLARQGKNATTTLDSLGLGGARSTRAFLSLANAGDLLRRSIELGTEAWEENTALAEEAERFYQTTGAALERARNAVTNLAADIAERFSPAIVAAADLFTGAVSGIRRHLDVVRDVAIAASVVVGGRLALSIGGAAIATAQATAELIRYNIALAAMQGISARAAVAQLALSRAMALTPWGIALTVGAAAFLALRARATEAAEATDDVRLATDELAASYIGLSEAELKTREATLEARAAELQATIDQIEAEILLAEARERASGLAPDATRVAGFQQMSQGAAEATASVKELEGALSEAHGELRSVESQLEGLRRALEILSRLGGGGDGTGTPDAVVRARIDQVELLARLEEEALRKRIQGINRELLGVRHGTDQYVALVRRREDAIAELSGLEARTLRTRLELIEEELRRAKAGTDEWFKLQKLRLDTEVEITRTLEREARKQSAIFHELLRRANTLQRALTGSEFAGVPRAPRIGETGPVGAHLAPLGFRPGLIEIPVEFVPVGPESEATLEMIRDLAEHRVEVEMFVEGREFLDKLGDQLSSVIQGVFSGVAATIGGPAGGAIGGLGAGVGRAASGALALDPMSALIGAGAGLLTSTLGDLFGAGGAAEAAARKAEAARRAWEGAARVLAELASPTGPLASATERAREAAQQQLQAAGIPGTIDDVRRRRDELLRQEADLIQQAAREQEQYGETTEETRRRIAVLQNELVQGQRTIRAYEAAIAGISQRFSEDLEIRALEAQGLDAAAAARRLEIEHAREMADVEALVAAGADEALIAQTEYVQELERAALAAERAAQAERDRLGFLERMAELSGDEVGATRIRAQIQAAEDIRNAEALLAQGLISAEEFAQFLELVTGSIEKAVEEVERARERQAAAFDADVAARFAAATGDQAEADRIRREFAAAEELARAQELAEAGIITQEALAALADVLELELAKAADEAARAAKQAAEDLEVRRLVALGEDRAADALRLQLEQQREIERAIQEGATEEFIRKLQEVQELEREAFERAARGAGRAVATAADEGADTVARNIQAITTDQAITIVHVLRTHTGHLSEIALNTRSLRGAGLGGRAPAAAGAARGGGATINIQLHGISDPRQFAERLIVLLRTDPRLRRELDAAQALALTEATEAAGMTGRGG